MIKSMTGFGRSEFNDGKRNIIVEIKSVNHRYSDISIKMPRRYSFAEEKLKSMARNFVKRGKTDISIIVENLTEDDINIQLNTLIAKQYYNNLIELKNSFDIAGEITLEFLSSLPDVMKIIPDVDDEAKIIKALEIPLKAAADKLDQMRLEEGKKLADDIISRGNIICGYVKKIEERSPMVAAAYKEKLTERIKELIGDKIELPEERIAIEAAIFADKCSIAEELVRLDSHINQLNNIIAKSNQPDGRKLDFLIQEMNREANTIGSKANDIEITNLVVEIKSEIEKIREQVQNVE